jgi:PAS domain S-box-containing protein
MASDPVRGPLEGSAIGDGDGDYRSLANALSPVIWICDADGRLEWVNDRWTELTGLGREETLRDKGGLVAVHPDDRENLRQRFADAIATGRTRELEYRIRTRGGDHRHHVCRLVPVKNEVGVVVRWVAEAFDMHDRRQAEEALRASERRFETAFQVNPQPMMVTRFSDGMIMSVNDAFLKMTGYSADQVLGKTAAGFGVWTAERRAEIFAPLQRAETIAFELVFPAKDGRTLTVDIRSARIDFGGEPCLISAATDVTEQRATEAALRKSEALARARADELAVVMDAVPAAVWIAQDPECRDMRGNQTGRALLRMDEGSNLSKTAADPTPTNHFRVLINQVEVAPDQLPLQRAARGDEVRGYEEEIHFDDGQVVHLYGSAVPLRDPTGAPRGSVGAFVDVTRLKQAEAAMREADHRKDEFLALLSHELRNPLAPIMTAVQLMELQGDVATPREREVIKHHGQHLVRLVDDLIDVSRVARGKVTLTRRRLELAAVVARALEATAPLLEERRHELLVSVAPVGLAVDADDVRLTQVVSNLLTNAGRYTPPGGHIEVTGAREDADVVLRVRDNGVGIDAALLPHVFDMFVQGPRDRDRLQGGMGLGLSLVKTLTELHGGKAFAHSDGPNRGSTFTVRLPASALAAADVNAAPAAPRRIASDRARRVLVVDDNRDAAEMISIFLSRAGHEVATAADASQALSVAVTFQPQVAVLDIGLPVMDGYALGRELRARLGGATPLLIALTGYGQEQDQRRSAEAGFAAHFVKPVDARKLVQMVDTLTTR